MPEMTLAQTKDFSAETVNNLNFVNYNEMVQVRKLSLELAQIAADELNESEARLKRDIQRLKQWMFLQPHFKAHMNDQWLAAFLRGNKFSLERAKEKLEKYYTARTLIPEIFQHRDPTVSPLRDLIQKGCFLPLTNRGDPAGPSLVLIRANFEAAKFPLNDVFKYSFLLIDLQLFEDDRFTVSGVTYICDMKDVTFQHIINFTPGVAKKCLKTFTEGYPVRIKGAHFLNLPTGFETILNLLRLFMPKKLKSRLHIHKTIDTLYDYVPKENLPKEYGGQAGKLDEIIAQWVSKFTSCKDILVESENYCTDENLRPWWAK